VQATCPGRASACRDRVDWCAGRQGGVVVLLGPAELQRLWCAPRPSRQCVLAATPLEHRVPASSARASRGRARAGGRGGSRRVTATVCARVRDPRRPYGPADALFGTRCAIVGQTSLQREESEWRRRARPRRAGGHCDRRVSTGGGGRAAHAVPGPSEVSRLGGAYADEVKQRARVDETLDGTAPSPPRLRRVMASGARTAARRRPCRHWHRRPGGGTPEAGRPRLRVLMPEASRDEFTYGHDRDSIRRRATVASLHLVRRLLTQSRDESA
jgi:hypothetical protein